MVPNVSSYPSRIVIGVCHANWPCYGGMSFSWNVIEYFKSHSFSDNHLNGSLWDMPMKKMDRPLGINIFCHKISVSKKYREHVIKPTHFHKLNYPCHWWMSFMPSPLIVGDQLTFVSVYIVVLTNRGPPGDLIDWTLTHESFTFCDKNKDFSIPLIQYDTKVVTLISFYFLSVIMFSKLKKSCSNIVLQYLIFNTSLLLCAFGLYHTINELCKCLT